MSRQNDNDLNDDNLDDWDNYEDDPTDEDNLDDQDTWDDDDDFDDWEDYDDPDYEDDDDEADDWGDDWDDGDDDLEDYDEDDDLDDEDDWDDDEDESDEWDDEPDDYDDWDDDEDFDYEDDDTDPDDFDEDEDDVDDYDTFDDDEDEYDEPDNELSDTDKDGIIKKLRKENAARRKKLQELQETNVSAIEETVSELVEGLTEAVGRDEIPTNPEDLFDTIRLQVERGAEARRDLAIYKAAGPLGIDTERLLDSRHFIDQVDELDSSSEEYEAEIMRLVQSTASTAPHLKGKPKVQRSGADLNSGSTTTPKEDMSIEALAEKRRKRRGIELKQKD